MYKLYLIASIVLIMTLSSCHTTPNQISSTSDYDIYLNHVNNQQVKNLKKDLHFWEEKLDKAPNQFPYLGKITAVQSQLFQSTGQIDYLINAENNLLALNERTGYKNPGYLRSLARNYISQHKFNAALKILTTAESIGENLRATQKMLFDIHLELGNDLAAKNYLSKINDREDFDYLIRLAKWKDHNGDLGAAIMHLEKGLKKAEDSKNKDLMLWAYTNLGDFYGHAGRIQEAYDHYLKALALHPHDAYTKKSIAWIVYSHERNAEEAMRILNVITQQYYSPDYYLLKAEIAEFMNDTKQKNKNISAYLSAVTDEKYGDMYNKYSAQLYAEEKNNISAAFKIAKSEISNRPTAASYDLLAWTHYHNGDVNKALSIMENHVVNHTFEPAILYHLTQVYLANGKIDDAMEIKQSLQESSFELGPLTAQKLSII